MGNGTNAKETLELLATQEETIGKLYHVYENSLSNKDLWSRLIRDESNHANWLRALSNDEKVLFDKDRFPLAAIKTMLKYINESILEGSTHDLQMALAIAYDIENSLMEKGFFEVFKTDSEKVQRIFNNLKNETMVHRTLVKDALDRVRNARV